MTDLTDDELRAAAEKALREDAPDLVDRLAALHSERVDDMLSLARLVQAQQAQINELHGAVQVLQRACRRQIEEYELRNEVRAERTVDPLIHPATSGYVEVEVEALDA